MQVHSALTRGSICASSMRRLDCEVAGSTRMMPICCCVTVVITEDTAISSTACLVVLKGDTPVPATCITACKHAQRRQRTALRSAFAVASPRVQRRGIVQEQAWCAPALPLLALSSMCFSSRCVCLPAQLCSLVAWVRRAAEAVQLLVAGWPVHPGSEEVWVEGKATLLALVC